MVTELAVYGGSEHQVMAKRECQGDNDGYAGICYKIRDGMTWIVGRMQWTLMLLLQHSLYPWLPPKLVLDELDVSRGAKQRRDGRWAKLQKDSKANE
jgi:hypothetical protein